MQRDNSETNRLSFFASYFAGVTKVKPGERWPSRVRTTRPPTRRVLRPGVEKSTPFSGGRYQDDQPYHHLSFPLPCVPPPSSRSPPRRAFSSSRTRLDERGSSLARTLASGKKFRSSAAFRRGGATLAAQESTLFLIRPSPPSSARIHIRELSPFLLPSSSRVSATRSISFSIFRSVLEYSRVRSQICGNAHTRTHTCGKKTLHVAS